MDTLLQDLRYALRALRRSPGFTAAAVLSLGLGIGANTTVFTWVSAVLLHPLSGVRDPGRLVVVSQTDTRADFISLSYLDFLDYERSGAVEGLLAADELSLGLSEGGRADRIWAQIVSENYFEVLGVPAARGRTFGMSDARGAGSAPYVVISHGLWQRRFGGDPGVVGRTVALNAQPFTIIGITGPEFRGSSVGLSIDAWVPLGMQPALAGGDDRLARRGNHWLQGVARLRPGQTLGDAESRLASVAARLVEGGSLAKGSTVVLHTFWDAPTGGTRALKPVLSVLMAVVAVVLLIACANVANLLLARATGRRREIAVRLSLGAGRVRLLRQLLTESVVLALLGGVVGLVMALWGSALLSAFTPPTDLPIGLSTRVDGQTLGFALGLSLATGIVFGLVPALEATRPSLATVLRDEAGSIAGGPARSRLRGSLVVAQVGLSVVLLVSAGLLLRSLHAARTAHPGFDPRGVLIASLDLQGAGYDRTRGLAFWADLLPRVRTLPGVESVTLARRVPLGFGGNSTTSLTVEGYAPPPEAAAWAAFHPVGPAYFRTLAQPLVSGRDFTENDAAAAPRVAIVSEEMARRYWNGRDPVGSRVEIRKGEWWTVIGVAREAKHASLTEKPSPRLYVPALQSYQPALTVLARTVGDPRAAAPGLISAMRQMDAGLPVLDVRTLEEHVQASRFAQRLGASLLSVFGGLAVLLASVGLYGVLAYAVGQRTREIGIRLALGGRARDILRLVAGQGLRLAALGLAAGLVGALGAGRAMRQLLIDVAPWDPLTFGVVAATLVAASAIACLLPARRATRVDPAIALRYE